MMTVQYDPASRPHIQTNHIDGPLLLLRWSGRSGSLCAGRKDSST